MSQTTPGVALKSTVDICLSTHKLCLQAVAFCIDRGGELADTELLHALLDCAEINQTAANFLCRVSRHSTDIVHNAGAVSQQTAEHLAHIEQTDGLLRSVYAACLQSADVCAEFGRAWERPHDDARDEILRDSFPASDPPPPPSEI
jgi:hypothetical protein